MTTQTTKYDEIMSPVAVTARGKPGATTTPVTLAGGTASVAPTTGAHLKGEIVLSDNAKLWYCTVAGTPGTWVEIGAGGGGGSAAGTTYDDDFNDNIEGANVQEALDSADDLISAIGPGFPLLAELDPETLNSFYPPELDIESSRAFASPSDGRLMARTSKGLDALVDIKRNRGRELEQWNAAVAGRLDRPANVYVIGDSITEGAGATAYEKVWPDIIRDGLQRFYRPGGEGFIPAGQATQAGFLFSPRWTHNAGVNLADIGAGFGRRAVLSSATAHTSTITIWCDRFYLVWTTGPSFGVARVTIDGLLAASPSTTSTLVEPGRIWDSGPLPLGYHTITVNPHIASNFVLLEGIVACATDATAGIHMHNGGHGGHRTWHYNGDTGEDGTSIGQRRNWAKMFFQPYARVTASGVNVSSDGANPSRLTWGGTSPAFTADDVGEVVFGTSDNNSVPRGCRITNVVSATVIDVDKQVTGGPYQLAFTRSRQTDAVRTSGSSLITSATAAFNKWDEGKTITGTGLLAGTTIRRVRSATQIDVYPAATSTGSGGTIQIKNRQLLPFRPDLLVIYLGANDISYGTSEVSYKDNIEAIVQTAIDVGNFDIPYEDAFGLTNDGGKVGIWNDERPSVCLVNSWSTAIIGDVNLVLSTVNGNNHVSANTTGILLDPRFTDADVGKVFSGAPLNGLSITAVDADGQGATLSGNASATNTAAAVILLVREIQDSHWDAFRRYNYELAAAHDWMHLDLANISDFNGVTDPLRILSYDNVHPNDRGHQWVADHFAKEVGGIPRMSSIPQGIFDNAGEMIVAEAADKAKRVPGIKRKLTADTASGIVAGVMVDITEWQFPIGANETLSFLVFLAWTAGLTTTGILFDFNHTGLPGSLQTPSQPADLIMCGWGPNGTTGAVGTGQWYGRQDASWGTDLTIPSSITAATTIPSTILLMGAVTAGAQGGIITPRFGPEATAATTLQRGSWMLLL